MKRQYQAGFIGGGERGFGSVVLLAGAWLMMALPAAAQHEPQLPPGARGSYIGTREDDPGALYIHRNGMVLRAMRIADDAEGRVRLRGPAEVAVKWDESVAPGEEPWPPGVTVIQTNILAEGIQRVEVAGDAALAAAALAAVPEVDFAYPVEFANPLFSRVVPTDRLIAKLAIGADIGSITNGYALDVVAPLIGTTHEYVLRLRSPKTTTAAAMAAALGASGLVDWVERDCLRDIQLHYTPADPRFPSQWHLAAVGQNINGVTAPTNFDLNITSAWDMTMGSTNVVVAIVDTGVDTNHPDLAANLTTNGAYDFYGNDFDPNPDDPNLDQHGTAVAGCSGAVESNGVGVVGVAPRCPLLPIKISGAGNFPSESQIANSVRQAAQYADIINCSWGYVVPATATLSAVQYALQQGAGGRGSVLFYSAGNEAGYMLNSITFSGPGYYDVRFRYVKDGSGSAGLDRCFVDTLFLPNGTNEFFDTLTPPALPAGYSSGGGAWTSMVEFAGMRPEGGTQFIGSPAISDNQSTYVQMTVTSPAAGSMLFYWMRVDAEPTTYSNNVAVIYDRGQVEYRPSGSGTWTTNNFQGGPPMAMGWPAADPETIAVGACDTTGRRAHYSCWGTNLDFVAPSEGSMMLPGIETTDVAGTNGYDNGDYCQNPYYGSQFSGTSASAPLAAGVGALVRSISTNLSPAQVRNILRATCGKLDTNWYTYNGRMGGRCDETGWGELDAAAALALATSTPPVKAIANNLKITEVSPVDGDCPFVEIYNSSPTTGFALENLMLTDCETGGDMAGGSFQFLSGSGIPPLGTVVVAMGMATTSLVAELTAILTAGGAMPGGLQLFECSNSGLMFNGTSIGRLQPHAMPVIPSGGSNNIALVVTPGMATSYLPDVVDGLGYGVPKIASGCAIGAGPGTPVNGMFATGATATDSYQRIGTVDTDVPAADFLPARRTPGRIVFGSPVQQLQAAPLGSAENALQWTPPAPGAQVLVAAGTDESFDYPAHGTAYTPGMMLGTDRIVYAGTGTTAVHNVGMPSTLRYYSIWVVDAATNYSAGVGASATTLPPPFPLPLADEFPGPGLNATSWPYSPGAGLDAAWVIDPPSAPNAVRLSGSNGSAELASTVYDASTNTNVHLVYRYERGGLGDPPETGDDLIVEVLNSSRMWMQAATHPGGGGTGFFVTNRIVLSAGQLHNQLRVRFRTTGVRSGPGDTDEWFLDDIVLEEFPVLSAFEWGAIGSPQSIGVPFPASLTALSSLGGTLTDYAGPATLQLISADPGDTPVFSPLAAETFLNGAWSNPTILVTSAGTSTVQLVALDGNASATSMPFQVLIDADDDTMPDAWEYIWFNGLTVASNSPPGDYDGDGLNDPGEYIADTCPTNPQSYFPPASAGYSLFGSFVFTIDPTSTGRVYEVSGTTNLMAQPQEWTAQGLVRTGTGAAIGFTITNDVPTRLYRTGVRLP